MSAAMHVQTPKPTPSLNGDASRALQRKCACGREAGPSGECAECRRKRLQRKEFNDAANFSATGLPPAVESVLRQPGRPLEQATRREMEGRFRHDFSQVRIHDNALAATSARQVHAQAYTVGRHIVFAARRFAPHTIEGRRLLAHELAHVVQQRDARYSPEDLAYASDRFEREADAAAQAVVHGDQPAMVHHKSERALIARFVESRTTTEPDGSEVQVERVVTPGRCRRVPETRSSTRGDVSLQQAFLEINACRGNVSGGVRGEVNYGDALNDAAAAAARLLFNIASGQRPEQAVRSFESDLRQLRPSARLRFNLGAPGFRLDLTGTGAASVSGGAGGQAQLRLEFDVGPATIGVQGEVQGGTQEQPSGSVSVTIEPRRRETPSDCFVCACSAPRIEFRCTRRTPRAPTPPPARPQPMIVPLFFEYADVTPRAGWERRYQEMLQLAVTRIRSGYTIARIEGFTSPEGPTQPRPGGRFEGNIRLAERRAAQAQADLQQALRADLGNLLLMRGSEHVRAALSASYPVVGRGELFGATAAGAEVVNRQLFSHLQSTLAAPQPGQPDPLAAAHATGERIPESVRAETEAQVAEFRTGQRGERRLTQAQRLEAIYQPLRRALIHLDPPPPPPPDIRLSPQILREIVGEPIECTDAHRRLFAGATIPPSAMFEGECSEPGRRRPQTQTP